MGPNSLNVVGLGGLKSVPSGHLADRALTLVADGPKTALDLCREVFGLTRAPQAIAERLAIALLGADPRIRRLPDGRWSRVMQAAGSPLIEDAAFAVVDVETTGGRAGGLDRLTEVAVVIVHGQRCEVVFETLINPERPIPSAVVAVTRITDEMVRKAPTFELVADQLLDAIAGRVFVAHNVLFDWRFLSIELGRSRGWGLEGDRLCTVRLARRLVPGLPSYGLDILSDYFGIENPARHRAGGDAWVTGLILQRLLDLARGQGARTLADLEQLGRRSRRRKTRGRRRKSSPESMF